MPTQIIMRTALFKQEMQELIIVEESARQCEDLESLSTELEILALLYI